MYITLRLVISILLVFCTPPTIDKYSKNSTRYLESSSKTAHFSSTIMEPTIVGIDTSQREIRKSSNSDFQDALIISHNSTLPSISLSFISSYINDRAAKKIVLKAVASRAPPRFKF